MVLSNPAITAFLMVVETGTVHAAAERLFLTQTAVTQRIKSLESSLSVSLFVRSKKGMALTAEGESFLHYARLVSELSAESEMALSQLAHDCPVSMTITASTTLMNSRVVPALKSVMQAHPQLHIRFDVDDDLSLASKLKRFETDLVITEPGYVPDSAQQKSLRCDEYVLVAAKSWARRHLHRVVEQETIIDYFPQDTMTFQYLQAFDLLSCAKKERMFANRTELLAELVSSGLGYTVLSKHFVAPYLQQKKLAILNQGRCLQQPLTLAWQPRPLMPAYWQQIIDLIE
mgnify:CR=1 FL=1